MSLAAVTAKVRGVALHLARADTGRLYCGRGINRNVDASLRTILFTWKPEEATCKQCLTRWKITKGQ